MPNSKPDSRIVDLIRETPRPLLSYEFFPPKDDAGMERLHETATLLAATRPDFVTCTWGAGGSTRQRTLEICEMLRSLGLGPVMPHLTCVGATRAELCDIADEIFARGFRNIMTLRGDPPKGQHTFVAGKEGLRFASELVTLLKQRHPEFCCGVAGYPEKHPEAPSLEQDLGHLREKISAGGDFITTQLFFDNAALLGFIKKCRELGLHQPVIAGLLPAMSLKQVRRFTELCGSSFPPALAARMEAAGGEGDEAEAAGIAWATRQVEDLLAAKACAGIHLYVLNRARAAVAPSIKKAFAPYRG